MRQADLKNSTQQNGPEIISTLCSLSPMNQLSWWYLGDCFEMLEKLVLATWQCCSKRSRKVSILHRDWRQTNNSDAAAYERNPLQFNAIFL